MLPRAPPTPHSRPAAYDATENNPFDCEKRDYFPKRGKERELSLIIPLKGLFENTRDIVGATSHTYNILVPILLESPMHVIEAITS